MSKYIQPLEGGIAASCSLDAHDDRRTVSIYESNNGGYLLVFMRDESEKDDIELERAETIKIKNGRHQVAIHLSEEALNAIAILYLELKKARDK